MVTEPAGELPEIRKRRSEIEIGANLCLSYRFAPVLYRYEISTVYEQYKLVLECRQSGLSDYHWCLEHDIKPGTFYNWVKRLRKAGTYTIPAPAGRDTYTAMPRQDIVKVELVEESVKIPRHGYPAGSDTEHIDGFPHSMELHIGSSSILVANDIDPVLLAQTIQMLKEAPPC